MDYSRNLGSAGSTSNTSEELFLFNNNNISNHGPLTQSTSTPQQTPQQTRRSQLPFSPPASMTPSVSEKYMSFPDEPFIWGMNDENPEDDDGLHYPDAKAKPTDIEPTGTLWTPRGFLNVGFLALLLAALLMLFAGYPILGYVRSVERTRQGGYNIGGVNATGQIAAMSHQRGLIDPDTPKDVYTRTGFDGKEYELVFSDEFNVDGRTFYPGEDPYWEAGDLHYWGTNNLEWYSPRQVTTQDGSLRLTLDKLESHNLDYEGALLSSWNKFCFTGGYISASIQLPGASDVWGLWPAFWTMGNLGRAGYGASLDGMWPYSYDSCDVGTLKNQSLNSYPPESVTNGDWAYDYSVSYLPGQRLSRCTCEGEDHPGPKHEDGTFKGRSAPEIDVLEAQVDQETRLGHLSMSAQFAPFNSFYLYDNSSDNAVLTHPDIDELNGYHGSVFQQSISGVIRTNQECYQFSGGCFDEYGFEYTPGADGEVKWSVGDEVRWDVKAAASGPDPITEIGQRTIPEEPMYILINQGISKNFGDIDWDELIFPSIMLIDWIRVYQPKGEHNIGCDPPNMPTADYISRHLDAYMNANLTTWDSYTDQRKPLNALENQDNPQCSLPLQHAPQNLIGL